MSPSSLVTCWQMGGDERVASCTPTEVVELPLPVGPEDLCAVT